MLTNKFKQVPCSEQQNRVSFRIPNEYFYIRWYSND